MNPLPVTVVAGYLGAGKTSLINHLLRHANGRRIVVLVNDFGALNIDADLLQSAQEDTLTLSNGCVCCTLGGDLYNALADALDRRPRPDCLVIEASGVADPAKIAAVARAEPDMRYGGVVTVVDAANLKATLADPLIGAQVAGQIVAADLMVLVKTDLAPAAAACATVRRLSKAAVVEAPFGAIDVDLVLDRAEAEIAVDLARGHAHAHGTQYASWSYAGPARLPQAALASLMSDPEPGLYRLKGRVLLAEGGAEEIHIVGRISRRAPCAPPPETRLTAIGVAPAFSTERAEARWRRVIEGE